MSSVVAFAIAHVAVLVAWGVLLGGMLGIGLAYRRLFARHGARGRDVYLALWTGYAFMLLAVQLWHLVRPVDGWLITILMVIGAAGLLSERGLLRPALAGLRSRGAIWAIVAAAVLILWLANFATGPVALNDAAVYEIPTIEWANAYSIVPGLGNVHGRLAFNSSGLLFAALVDVGPFDGRAYHIANGVLLVPLVLHAVASIRRLVVGESASPAGDAYAACLTIPILFATISHASSSLDTDLPLVWVMLACGERVFRSFTGEAADEETSRWHFASIVLLSATAVVLKLSAAVIALSLLLFAAWTFRALLARSVRSVLLALVAPSLLVGSWMVRGAILSGYPLYPSTLFAMPVDWRLPLEQAQAEGAWVRFSAQLLLQKRIPVDENWIASWFADLFKMPQDAVLLFLPLTLAIIAGIAILRSRRGAAGEPLARAWTVFIPSAIGLVFWFVVAPHPRFAQAALWLLACMASGLAWTSQRADADARMRRARRITTTFVAIVGSVLLVQAAFSPIEIPTRVGWVARASVLGGLAVRPGRDQGFHPVGTAKTVRYKTHSGLEMLVPLSSNSCWRSAIICTPHPSPYVRMRREGHPEAGFAADSGRWEPARWPEPVIAFLPYWRCVERGKAAGADRTHDCAVAAQKIPTDTLAAVILAQGGDTVAFTPPARGGRARSGR